MATHTWLLDLPVGSLVWLQAWPLALWAMLVSGVLLILSFAYPNGMRLAEYLQCGAQMCALSSTVWSCRRQCGWGLSMC